MERILLQAFATYGKGSGRELHESYVIEDSKEDRQEFLDEYLSWGYETYEDIEAFVNGDNKILKLERDGVDWDESTGLELVTSTFDEEVAKAKEEYEHRVKALEVLFRAGEEKA